MTLDEFIKTTHLEVEQFKAYYLKARAKAAKEKNGEVWPLSTGEGDWYEQFIAWQQAREKS